MALRDIRTFDDEALRQKCRPVDKVDHRIRKILGDMADTMYRTKNGGGLAANQIGILKRLVVIDMGEGLIKLVNPEIVAQEGEQQIVEGCLSFPDIWGKVKRPEKMIVRALNEDGKSITVEGTGMMAVCLSHELDHLDGQVFIDKVVEFVE